MTQSELNALFAITITIHNNMEYFKSLDRERFQDWIRKQLADALNIYTKPVGMSWGVLTSKEEYEKYMKKIEE